MRVHVTMMNCVQGLRRSCQTEVTRVNCRFCRVPIKRAIPVMAQSAKLGRLHFVLLIFNQFDHCRRGFLGTDCKLILNLV